MDEEKNPKVSGPYRVNYMTQSLRLLSGKEVVYLKNQNHKINRPSLRIFQLLKIILSKGKNQNLIIFY